MNVQVDIFRQVLVAELYLLCIGRVQVKYKINYGSHISSNYLAFKRPYIIRLERYTRLLSTPFAYFQNDKSTHTSSVYNH